jgi:hypothetical protein
MNITYGIQINKNIYLSRVIVSDKSYNKKELTIGLQHHSQIQAMVDNKLCYKCKRGLPTRVLHIQG